MVESTGQQGPTLRRSLTSSPPHPDGVRGNPGWRPASGLQTTNVFFIVFPIVGGFFCWRPYCFCFCLKIQTESDKIMTLLFTLDIFPETTLSHINILLVHSLKFGFIFGPLVRVKEGQLRRPTEALPKNYFTRSEGICMARLFLFQGVCVCVCVCVFVFSLLCCPGKWK